MTQVMEANGLVGALVVMKWQAVLRLDGQVDPRRLCDCVAACLPASVLVLKPARLTPCSHAYADSVGHMLARRLRGARAPRRVGLCAAGEARAARARQRYDALIHASAVPFCVLYVLAGIPCRSHADCDRVVCRQGALERELHTGRLSVELKSSWVGVGWAVAPPAREF
eukprot:COSAG01_NODE_10054_length_2261_cov_2.590657_1_plen_169_part_00